MAPDRPERVKISSEDALRFIGSSFRSVWALELLLVLKADRRPWATDELVATMRASDLVVAKALEALEAAGLVAVHDGVAEYMPSSNEVAALVARAEDLYAKRPDAVRRAIVSASSNDATAFADAFRLRRD